MKYLQTNNQTIGRQDYDLVEEVGENYINIFGGNSTPTPSVPTYLPEGLSIVDGGGRIHVSSNTWTETLGLTGIGVNSENNQFIFAVADELNKTHTDDNSIDTLKRWSLYLQSTVSSVVDITSTTDSTIALADFRSKENTDAIIAAVESVSETDNAARVCRNYSAGTIKAGKWDLPALGILGIINNLVDPIGLLMDSINKHSWFSTLLGSPDWDTRIWSSTEYGGWKAWDFCYFTNLPENNNKETSCFVIPVYTIN